MEELRLAGVPDRHAKLKRAEVRTCGVRPRHGERTGNVALRGLVVAHSEFVKAVLRRVEDVETFRRKLGNKRIAVIKGEGHARLENRARVGIDVRRQSRRLSVGIRQPYEAGPGKGTGEAGLPQRELIVEQGRTEGLMRAGGKIEDPLLRSPGHVGEAHTAVRVCCGRSRKRSHSGRINPILSVIFELGVYSTQVGSRPISQFIIQRPAKAVARAVIPVFPQIYGVGTAHKLARRRGYAERSCEWY